MTDRPLRVLQLNHADRTGGGAAVAGHRLHLALRASGVDSQLCVGEASGLEADQTVLQHPRGRRVLRKVGYELGLNELDGVGAYRLPGSALVASADVVHAHALEGGWFSYPAVARIARRRPTVLTLHDMWPFTGHCSFAYDCDRWRSGCGRCPHPDTFPAIRRDATKVEWRLKRATWDRAQLSLVAPSRWMARQVDGGMLAGHRVEVIPHGIDHHLFAPGDPSAARTGMGISPQQVVVMFAAASLGHRPDGGIDRKGTDLVADVLAGLPDDARRGVTALLMGARSPALAAALGAAGVAVVEAGLVTDDARKVDLYAAADVFLFPTRADNAPLVVLEAMACGTPVLATDVGGLREMVRPGATGVLAPAGDVAALRAALAGLVRNGAERRRLSLAARALVEREHTEALAVARHRALYEELRR